LKARASSPAESATAAGGIALQPDLRSRRMGPSIPRHTQ
jgi:hypothetical protein